MGSRKTRDRRPGKAQAGAGFVVEALEPRLLLSADPLGLTAGDGDLADLPEDPADYDPSCFDDLTPVPAPGIQDFIPRDALPRVEAPPAMSLETLGSLSALNPPAVDADIDVTHDGEELGVPVQPESATRLELVFIDSGVADAQTLLDAIEGEPVVVLLDAGEDGLEQIGRTLAGYAQVDAVHILAHAAGQGIQLGSTHLDQQTIADKADLVQAWGRSLDPEADLLLYGCDLAGSETGQGLVQALADLTGADVAASVDTTGHADLGGNWELEYSSGSVETQGLLDSRSGQNWHGVLGLSNPLWLSIDGSIGIGNGVPGMDAVDWDDGDVVEMGPPNLAFGPGTTDGTFSLAFHIESFIDSENVNGIHYVASDITVGGANAINLQTGDLILSTSSSGTLVSNGAGAPPNLDFKKEDVFFFRPDTPGDYTQGNFHMLLQDPLDAEIRGLTLIEKDTWVGDHWLYAGDFLFGRSGGSEDNDVWLYETTDVEDANPLTTTTAGTASVLLEGDDPEVDIDKKIYGLDLVETALSVGGVTLNAGTILMTVDGSETVGQNGLAVTHHDIFALEVTQTTQITPTPRPGIVDGSLWFQGSNLNFNSNSEQVDGFTLTVPHGSNTAPTLGNNSLTLDEGGTVVLTGADLSATDAETAAGSLAFSVSNLSGGQFELVSNPNVAITGFTQAQVTGSQVRFVHDGGETAPAYEISVSDGALIDGPSAAAIGFTNQNDAPVLGNNSLTLDEGGTVVLTGLDLSASDVETAAGSLGFAVSNLSGGQFELVSNPNVAVSGFTQAQLTGGQVRFVHDGGETAPAYEVSVTDGASIDGPSAAAIGFTNQNDAPVLGNNSLTLDEGGAVVLSPADLSASDVETAAGSLGFTVSSVSGGQFELVSNPNAAITGFTQAQVMAGAVRFVHNGGESAPTYRVSVSDGSASAGPALAVIGFTNQNDAPDLDNSGSMLLVNVLEDNTDPLGNSVATIIDSAGGDRITDPDSGALEGMAVIGVDDGNGTWQYSLNGGGSWTGFVASGVANGSLDNANAVLLHASALIRFVPDAAYTGSSGNISFRAWDQTLGNAGDNSVNVSGNGGGTPFSSATETAGLTVVAASGVTNLAPGAQSVDEDGLLVLSVANGNAIRVDDGSSGDPLLRTELTASNGILTLAGTVGLSFESGASGTGSMVIVGQESAINAALDGMTFTPAGDFSGAADIQVVTDLMAGTLGYYSFDNPADPGNDDSPAGANDAAWIDGASAAVSGVRGSVLAFDGNDLVRIDGVFGNPANVTLSGWVDLNAPRADMISLGDNIFIRLDELGVGVTGMFYDGSAWQGTPSGTFIDGTGWHHIAYTFDDAGNQQVLYIDGVAANTTGHGASIVYAQGPHTYLGRNGNVVQKFLTGSLDDVRIYDRTLTAGEISALFQDTVSDTDTIDITVNPVNDAPGLTAGGSNPTYTEGAAAAGLFNGTAIDLGEPGDRVNSLTLTIAGLADGADEFLYVDGEALALTQGNSMLTAANGYQADVSVSAGTATVTLAKGSGYTAAAAEVLVDGLGYKNTSTDPQGASRTITLTTIIDDGGSEYGGVDATAISVTSTVNLSAQNDAPVLIANTLTLAEGETLVLGAGELSATDADDSDPDLVFSLSNVSGGRFELVAAAGNPITGFTQLQLANGDVQFVHDGGESAPAYEVSVSDGALSDGPAAANIAFTHQNDAPLLGNNGLVVDEGATVVLGAGDLSATDVDDSDPNLVFTVSNVVGGQFEFVALAGSAITSFTQLQLTDAEVQFVHDGDPDAPGYDVSVSDGNLSDGPASAVITFNSLNDAPILGNNSLSIGEGQTLVLSGTDLSATDVDNADPNLVFILSNVTGGQFEFVAAAGATINGFTQQQLTDGDVQFVHDGGETAPAYEVSVSDGALSDGPTAAAITFTSQNDAPVLGNNSLSINEGDTLVLRTGQLSATDADDVADDLLFTVSNVSGARFELVTDLGVPVFSFTQAQIAAGQVRLVHTGGANAPGYEVTVSDSTLAVGPSAAAIVFTPDPPAPPPPAPEPEVPPPVEPEPEVPPPAPEPEVPPPPAPEPEAPPALEPEAPPPVEPQPQVPPPPSPVPEVPPPATPEPEVPPPSDPAPVEPLPLAPEPAVPLPVEPAPAEPLPKAPEPEDPAPLDPEPNDTRDPNSESVSGRFIEETVPDRARLPAVDNASQVVVYPGPAQAGVVQLPGSGTRVEDLLAAPQEETGQPQSFGSSLPVEESGELAPLEDLGDLPHRDLDFDASATQWSYLDNLQSLMRSVIMRPPVLDQVVQESMVLMVELGVLPEEEGYFRELDGFRQDMDEYTQLETAVLGSSVVFSTSLSIGYVTWLARGGLLLSSLLSSLPAWQFLDPLPVLARVKRSKQDEQDDESLESMVETEVSEPDADRDKKKAEKHPLTGAAIPNGMKGLKAKTRIAIGQVGILVSVVLAASMLDLIPDRASAVREGRAALAEAIAANSSNLITQADLKRLAGTLGLVVKRNDSLLSAAVRHADGGVAISVGPHERLWAGTGGGLSTDTHVRVPIWAGDHRWGDVELMFSPIWEPSWLGFSQHPLLKLVLFVALVCLLFFYVYLGKMLKHLDPSQAIPARVRSALDTMAEGLLVLDEKANIVLANAAFARIVNKQADDLMGFNASDFRWTDTSGNPLAKMASPWDKAMGTGEAQLGNRVRLLLPEDERHTFMINCSPVMGARDKPDGVLISLDDVTELEEKEIQLRKSKEEAETANRAKSEFLANMSHEIRTPMNAILGFTEVLKRGYGGGKLDSMRYLNTIHSSGRHLLELINDILDLSKVEAGRLEVERTECKPHRIVQEVVKILGVRAAEKGISLTSEAVGELPETIQSDPARLRQIVTNLVGNAIKFTEQGGVRVIIRMNGDQQTPGYHIDVADTGIGMARDTLDSVFDAFVQADSSITRRFGGTGLGLAISRRFAKALGGDIRVTSEPGKGSLFSVALDPGPLEGVPLLSHDALQTQQADGEDLPRGHWVFPPRRLLVVDDGDENRELVTLVLGEAGLRLDGAENGQVGVSMAMENQYDAILMDVQMPVMDGFTATRQLRERGWAQPIIALTGNAMKGVKEECLAGGFTGYMAKPIDIDRLLGMLAQILGGRYVEESSHRSGDVGVEQQTPGDTSDQTPLYPSIGESSLAARPPTLATAETKRPVVSRLQDNPKLQPLIRRFEVRLRQQMETIERALEAEDLQELAALSHWLKGAGGTLGFDVFTEPAMALELAVKQGSRKEMDEFVSELRQLVDAVVVPEIGDEQRSPAVALH